MSKAEGRKDYYMVPPDKLIIEEGFNPREDYGKMEELKASIRARGVRDPLEGNKSGDFFIVRKGHRRTRAVKEIFQETGEAIFVKFFLEPRFYTDEQRTMDLLVDNTGLHFTPWERAKLVVRALKYGKSEEDIAEETGLTLVYVRRLASLANAPQKLINLVKEGRVKGTFAMDMIAEKRVDELLAKAESTSGPIGPSDDDLFPTEKPVGKPSKITRSDLRPNSWKAFRKWVPAVDEKSLSPQKAEAYEFLQKMINGELSEEDFKSFFS